jgi:hypothetical protein
VTAFVAWAIATFAAMTALVASATASFLAINELTAFPKAKKIPRKEAPTHSIFNGRKPRQSSRRSRNLSLKQKKARADMVESASKSPSFSMEKYKSAIFSSII